MKYLLIFLFALNITLFPQGEDKHIWRQLVSESGEKFWYDPTTFDSVSNDRLDVWILESHRPPLRFEGIEADVYRSKILYTINLLTAKYGLKKIRYYGLTNKELYSYDYDMYISDDTFSFPYPIITGSKIHLVLQEFLKKKRMQR
ncbi:MAG: hypothetical protein NZM09_04055 [Ignavibacterium sp.]|nr:hypothetical protein [Ignavibacterium sp.]MCX7612470.1 hypothetical protein [Ignavibacterium sp.]MDW8374850.1 hypothetical protein [Ignavibacteriales bacterium]